MHSKFTILLVAVFLSLSAQSQTQTALNIAAVDSQPTYNILDDLDPYDPNIEEILKEYDEIYERETGQSAFLQHPMDAFYDLFQVSTCQRQTCAVWAQIVKSTQTMYLYVHGEHVATWKVSTGLRGSTPNFDKHPNGRVYDRYTSRSYPGGDYKGLGNMPYAVFIHGGFAIHGTPKSNWPKLGQPASHGCIRLHPDHGFQFNRLVRQYGVKQVWITVQH